MNIAHDLVSDKKCYYLSFSHYGSEEEEEDVLIKELTH